jgi:RNA polymerase sigma-70 factor (ECF subfamily)
LWGVTQVTPLLRARLDESDTFDSAVKSSGTFSPPLRLPNVGVVLALRQVQERQELDEVTLARCKRRDSQAFGDLVRFYERPVFSLLSRMLVASRQPHLVEDLAQETFVRAYRAIDTFGDDGRQRLSSWLLTIATRVALDALRKRSPVSESLDIGRHELAGGATADDQLHRRTLREAIETAVERLAPEYRAAFLLREVHDMDYQAIAEALAVDLGTIKSRLSRARAVLRAALAEVYP